MSDLIKCWGIQYMRIDDGGRAAAGFKGEVGDCALRAICIATGYDYAEVRKALMHEVKMWSKTSRSRAAKRRRKRGAGVFEGLEHTVFKAFMTKLGWEWTPTMLVGSGCRVRLRAEDLPGGTIICQVSKHWTVMIDGTIHDTHDPSRKGTRCVYGYWWKPKKQGGLG